MTLSMTLLAQERKPVLHITCLRHPTLIVLAETLQNFVHGINFLLWISFKNSEIFTDFSYGKQLESENQTGSFGADIENIWTLTILWFLVVGKVGLIPLIYDVYFHVSLRFFFFLKQWCFDNVIDTVSRIPNYSINILKVLWNYLELILLTTGLTCLIKQIISVHCLLLAIKKK